MTARRAVVASLVLGGLLAGCGASDEEGGGADGPAARATPSAKPTAEAADGREPVVDMTDSLQFEPRELTVEVGERVVWRNAGEIAHTVTTDPAKVANADGVSVPDGVEPWDSGLIGGGETYERRIDKPGTYRYVCIPHEGARMVGTVTVEG